MSERFFLFHSTEHAKLESYLSSADWSMTTCLRTLALFSSLHLPRELESAAPGGVEVYVDEDAYGFLLEIVCGLHSPILGETEVMGQFKASFQALSEDSRARGFLKSLLTDAKKIRTQHLSGMGSQSYGSLCRKELQGMNAVHLLGAGKLTKDLLPWFLEFPQVEIYCRSVKRGESLKDAYPKVEVYPWTATFGTEALSSPALTSVSSTEISPGPHEEHSALVIAAPISDAELSDWMDVHGHDFEKIIDLRAESAVECPSKRMNPSSTVKPVSRVGLTQLFESVKSNQEEMSARVIEVKKEIEVLVRKRANHIQIRPLGWDEICA